MAVQYKMEITGKNGFAIQGGTNDFRNAIAIQTNHGTDSHGSKVSKGMPKEHLNIVVYQIK